MRYGTKAFLTKFLAGLKQSSALRKTVRLCVDTFRSLWEILAVFSGGSHRRHQRPWCSNTGPFCFSGSARLHCAFLWTEQAMDGVFHRFATCLEPAFGN
jgi:hypothetical protein